MTSMLGYDGLAAKAPPMIAIAPPKHPQEINVCVFFYVWNS